MAQHGDYKEAIVETYREGERYLVPSSILFFMLVFLGVWPKVGLAASISVGGQSVAVVQPQGYCWMDASGAEHYMVSQAQSIFAGSGQELLAMFSDCKELKALRAGKKTTLDRFGSITVDVNRAGQVIRTTKTRRELIDQTVAGLAKASAFFDPRKFMERANAAVPGSVLEMSTPKVISQDSNAVYVAGVTSGRTSQGVNRLTAAIVGTTVIKGLVLNVVTHRLVQRDPYD